MTGFKLLPLAAALFACAPATAATFTNDFSNGLGANESVEGAFAVGNGYVGHQTVYSDLETSRYSVLVNFLGGQRATLGFDYDIALEDCCDKLSVSISDPDGNNAAPLALFSSNVGRFETDLGTVSGSRRIDFLFTSDRSVVFRGVQLDNVSISNVAAAPEPTAWAMMIGGFGIAGGALRRRRAAGRPAVRA